MTTLWWVSWREVTSPDDPRPLRCPPGPNVIAWWCSGYAGDGSYATMVALVAAPVEAAIEKAVAQDWPSPDRERTWRFRRELGAGVLHINDRFPFEPWSLERLQALGVAHDVEVAR